MKLSNVCEHETKNNKQQEYLIEIQKVQRSKQIKVIDEIDLKDKVEIAIKQYLNEGAECTNQV